MPKVAVSVKMMSSIRSMSDVRHRTLSSTPGRFFFIWIDVVKTSIAPASNSFCFV